MPGKRVSWPCAPAENIATGIYQPLVWVCLQRHFVFTVARCGVLCAETGCCRAFWLWLSLGYLWSRTRSLHGHMDVGAGVRRPCKGSYRHASWCIPVAVSLRLVRLAQCYHHHVCSATRISTEKWYVSGIGSVPPHSRVDEAVAGAVVYQKSPSLSLPLPAKHPTSCAGSRPHGNRGYDTQTSN